MSGLCRGSEGEELNIVKKLKARKTIGASFDSASLCKYPQLEQ